jgi:hypothetical protein
MDEIILRVGAYELISVRGTSACGETALMQLLANRLFTYYGQSPPTYTLAGWEPKKCKKEAVGSVFPSGQSGQAWSSTGPDCAKAGF